jgi:hypothetical protein
MKVQQRKLFFVSGFSSDYAEVARLGGHTTGSKLYIAPCMHALPKIGHADFTHVDACFCSQQ